MNGKIQNVQTEALTRWRKMNFIQMKLVLRLTDSYNVARLESMKTLKIARLGRLCLAGIVMGCTLGLAAPAHAAPQKVLVVTVTLGFRHSSIPTAEKVLAKLAEDTGAFTVDYARVEPNDPQFKGDDGKPDKAKVDAAIKAVLAEKMSAEALKQYDAVIFANTTGDLPLPDNQAFLDWIKSGKGFVGMHAAADTFHGFNGYLDMLGAEFKTHAAQLEVQPINQDPQCPACAQMGKDWKVFDEIYQMQKFDPAKVHRSEEHTSELQSLRHLVCR